MINKIKKIFILKDPNYIKWGISKYFQKFKNYLSEYFIPIIKIKIKKRVNSIFPNSFDFQNRLNDILGDFSSFEKYENIFNKEKILIKSKNILDRRYDILGSGPILLNPINWHKDYKSNYIWNKNQFYLKYVQVDLSNNADVKFPRELSRSHHLLTLGQAYLLTNDEQYTKEFIFLIRDWIKENPFMFSINWGCAMDVSIRSSNWIFSLNMFKNSELIDETFISEIMESLYQHGFFIYRNLEKSYKISGNHYASNISGLVLLGLIFKTDYEGNEWFEYSYKELLGEIRTQVSDSGLSLDRSLSYNKLVLEFFSFSYFILHRNKYSFPDDIEKRINKMFDFINEISFDDSTYPNIADQDNGRYLPFEIENQHRSVSYLLSYGATFFKNNLYKFKSSISSGLFFVLGEDAIKNYNSLESQAPSNSSHYSLFDAGYFKIHNRKVYILITNGLSKFVKSPHVSPSHIHADLLSFTVYSNGDELFVDSGTYLYTSNKNERNRFRSTKMHNTICVDNKNQFITNKNDLFSFESFAKIEHLKWETSSNNVTYIGKHDGYNWLIDNFSHTREFKYDIKKKILTIIDFIHGDSKKTHNFKFNLYTHPKISNLIKDNKIQQYKNNMRVSSVKFENTNIKYIKIIDSSYSPSYGKIKKNQKIELSLDCKIPFKLITEIKFYE